MVCRTRYIGYLDFFVWHENTWLSLRFQPVMVIETVFESGRSDFGRENMGVIGSHRPALRPLACFDFGARTRMSLGWGAKSRVSLGCRNLRKGSQEQPFRRFAEASGLLDIVEWIRQHTNNLYSDYPTRAGIQHVSTFSSSSSFSSSRRNVQPSQQN
jgi:hypothetical protein